MKHGHDRKAEVPRCLCGWEPDSTDTSTARRAVGVHAAHARKRAEQPPRDSLALARVQVLHRARADLERDLEAAVQAARAAGWTWQEVADALDVSKPLAIYLYHPDSRRRRRDHGGDRAPS